MHDLVLDIWQLCEYMDPLIPEMDNISRRAAQATANALMTSVQGISAIVGCTMVVKGIKAGVPYLNVMDNEKAAPYISGGCTALYVSFLIAAARTATEVAKNN